MSNKSSGNSNLSTGLALSLTFWTISGILLWLALCLKNRLYHPNLDVVKIWAACTIWYAAVGLLLWLPVYALSKVLQRLKFLGKNEYTLQLGLHWLVAFLLSFFYSLHKIWFPDMWALSLMGISLTLLLVIVGILTAIIVVKIYSGLRYLTIFRSHFRTLIACTLLFWVIYGVACTSTALHNRGLAKVPPELNAALPTGAKVMLLGFDAATWDAITPLLKEGKLPNIARLMEGSVVSPLKTSRPTLSAILWTTIATGKTSKRHGVTEIVSTIAPGLQQNVLNYPQLLGSYVFAGLLRKEGFFQVTPLSSTARNTKAIWNILTDYNQRVGIVGWWGSFPPEPVNGVVISDHASMVKNEMRAGKGQLSEGESVAETATSPVYPPELAEELRPMAEQATAMSLEELHYFLQGDSAELAYINSLTGWDRDKIESVIKISYLTDKYFQLCAEHLLDTRSFDLLSAYFFETDAIAHWFWNFRKGVAELFPRISAANKAKYQDVIDNTYINTDRTLGSVLDHAPPDLNIIIISDHGFGVERYGSTYSVGHDNAPDGIIIMKGPDFNPQAQFNSPPRIVDITPTILALLGIPLGADMEGRALTEVFNPDFLQKYPLRTIPSHDRGLLFKAKATFSGEDKVLKEKLRALGYIQ